MQYVFLLQFATKVIKLSLMPVHLFACMYFTALSTGQKSTTHQLTIMLSTSKNAKNVLFAGHIYHLLTTNADDPTL